MNSIPATAIQSSVRTGEDDTVSSNPSEPWRCSVVSGTSSDVFVKQIPTILD